MPSETSFPKIKPLPLSLELMTTELALKLGDARSSLAELKGKAKSIPNEGILLNTLPLQEAKDSSETENIITTHKDLFFLQAEIDRDNPAEKEAYSYIPAILKGYKEIKKESMLRLELLCDMQSMIVGNTAGIRTLSGTVLKDSDENIVYTPPQDTDEIRKLLRNLLEYINMPDMDTLHPLIKMALIHHQFESIHPFYDGNGRIGRIINILYLIMSDLLDTPILYLSRYITHNKSQYYELLQLVRKQPSAENWRRWVIYTLRAVEVTARETRRTIDAMTDLMKRQKKLLRKETKFYSQDLLNMLFHYPISSRKLLGEKLRITRATVTKYGKTMEKIGIVKIEKYKGRIYYINRDLLGIFENTPDLSEKSNSGK